MALGLEFGLRGVCSRVGSIRSLEELISLDRVNHLYMPTDVCTGQWLLAAGAHGL